MREAEAEAEAEAKAEAEAEAKGKAKGRAKARASARAKGTSQGAALDYERMPVFHLALGLYVLVDDLRKCLPRVRRFEAEQLQRAALSVLLNTAEGSGESAPREKARIYRIARRSATECGAVFHALRAVESQLTPICRKGRNLVFQITAQLTGLCRSMEQRARQSERP